MLENIAYVGLGFATVFFALETAWHFTACKIHDKSIKPCFYKQVDLLKQIDRKREVLAIMASIESSSKARRRTKSLKMKTPSLVNKASKISPSKAIEVQRIIARDGFGYFPTPND